MTENARTAARLDRLVMRRVVCTHCCGTGRVDLTGVYLETLTVVVRLCSTKCGFVVANRDAHLFGCKPTALNNRLEWLERHGLVSSTKYGRQRRFVAA